MRYFRMVPALFILGGCAVLTGVNSSVPKLHEADFIFRQGTEWVYEVEAHGAKDDSFTVVATRSGMQEISVIGEGKRGVEGTLLSIGKRPFWFMESISDELRIYAATPGESDEDYAGLFEFRYSIAKSIVGPRSWKYSVVSWGSNPQDPVDTVTAESADEEWIQVPAGVYRCVPLTFLRPFGPSLGGPYTPETLWLSKEVGLVKYSKSGWTWILKAFKSN